MDDDTPTTTPPTISNAERRTRIVAELRAAVRAFEREERARAVRAGRRPPRTAAEIRLAEEGQLERQAKKQARADRARRRQARRAARAARAARSAAAEDARPAVEPIDLDAIEPDR